MLEAQADLWSLPAQAVCITTNGVVAANGRLVMGGGCAFEARERYPDLNRVWGQMTINFGPGVYTYEVGDGPALVSFPTKDHWKDPSTLTLIKKSTKSLVYLTNHRGWDSVLLPAPGTGLGQLDYETQVKPLLEPLLDSRFTVVRYPK